jgi:hypothetical protein
MPSQSIAGFMIAGYSAEAGDADGMSCSWRIEIRVMAVDEVQEHPGRFDHVQWAVSMYVSMCPRGT